jgi:hypothetical protein
MDPHMPSTLRSEVWPLSITKLQNQTLLFVHFLFSRFRAFLYVHASYLSEDCQACLLFFTTDRDSFFSLSDAKKNIVDVNSFFSFLVA